MLRKSTNGIKTKCTMFLFIEKMRNILRLDISNTVDDLFGLLNIISVNPGKSTIDHFQDPKAIKKTSIVSGNQESRIWGVNRVRRPLCAQA